MSKKERGEICPPLNEGDLFEHAVLLDGVVVLNTMFIHLQRFIKTFEFNSKRRAVLTKSAMGIVAFLKSERKK